MAYEKERVLCVATSVKDKFFYADQKFISNFNALKALVHIMEEASFYDRNDELENNEDMLQLIPYTVLIDNKCRIFTYKRSGETGEERLTDKLSFGIGGHVKDSDTSYDLTDRTTTVYLPNVKREITEELGEQFFINCIKNLVTTGSAMSDTYIEDSTFLSLNVQGLIFDNSNKVGRVHLGILIVFAIWDSPKVDSNSEFAINRTWNSWVNLHDILEEKAIINKLEGWSRIVWDSYITKRFCDML